MKKYLLIAPALVSFAVEAQVSVPAIDPLVMVAPDVAYGQPIKLDAKERAALAIAEEWKNNPDKPRRSADGSVVYLFGATLPTLICTTLQVCTILLQPGEVVNDEPHAGDAARWEISPARIGSGSQEITVIVVKPLERGMVTSLVVTTNRRIYTIKLVSPKHEDVWMPRMSFVYPEDTTKAWNSYKSKQKQAVHASTLATGENIADLDFSFKIGGDNPGWKPVRVYRSAEKGKTYVQFSSEKFIDGAPALVVIGSSGKRWSGKSTEIVNYGPYGDKYVVDGLPDRMALISGIGSDQVEVTIDYVGGKK